ncbi:phage tail protein [Novosphingobium sp. RD2P27]|uniref:Phage tail protein n=1 Tax=Novosphingobium kalidii TaxID=3230299 RepID=A0ABV2CZK2_9SPHN
MATLVLGAVGTALGGPVGGAIGALAGRQLDGLVLGSASRSGPRLRELEVSLSSYGNPIPRVYGRMRVAGAIVWATELQEHSETRSGGKGQSALKAYTYTANLAVALSSRPILGLGRVWADGKLLRGAAGDLKVGGTLRIHTGAEDQAVDPLIAASEGEARCPAFRGIAYAVFENLELSDFGNRIPALTFEVLADDAVRLSDLVDESPAEIEAHGELGVLSGLVVDGSLDTTLSALEPVLPIAIDAAGASLVMHVGDEGAEALLLDEAASATDDDAFGRVAGFSRRREPFARLPSPALRYADVDRDYQPGTQHATGLAGPGYPDLVELPAALSGSNARMLVERLALRRDRGRERIAWRTSTVDAKVAPGSRMRLPDYSGTWRVESWEWREAGVELELVRTDVAAPKNLVPTTGLFPAPVDLPAASTQLVALELPWDGSRGDADAALVVAAVGATGTVWSGATLYADRGDGQLLPLGSSGRERAVIGFAKEPLAPASPLLFDRTSHLLVVLTSQDQVLSPAGFSELGAGANLALIGNELVQFGRADPVGAGRWRLSQLLRGCGGTEHAICDHQPDEPFVLLTGKLTSIDSNALGYAEADIAAIGRGDTEPVISPIRLRGIGSRPLTPVHGRSRWSHQGVLALEWTRRARGGWRWTDGIDVPLGEEAERYLVTFENAGAALRAWSVDQPVLNLSADEIASLSALAATGTFHVRQQGTRALSAPLFLISLS